MCALKVYLATALLATSTMAITLGQQYEQQQQWARQLIDYNNFYQPQSRDQQYQPSDYSYSGYGGDDSGPASFDDHSGSQPQHDFGGHNFDNHNFDNHNYGGHNVKAETYPVHQHVEEENPEPIKHYKEVVVPLPKNVEFKINQPVIIPVPHPVPIQVPVPKAVVIPIVKEVTIPVEKSVPYPVEKTVHVPKIKEVPFEVVKHILVPVEKPIPFKVPVYETIIHTKKGSHKI